MSSSYPFEILSLSSACLLSGYLTISVWTPPNPNPSLSISTPHDTFEWYYGSSRILLFRRLFGLCLWVHQTLLVLTYPLPPFLLCPCSSNLSALPFTWNWFTKTTLGLILFAAPIRLLAFRHLGQSFTFRLARPQSGLVTNGLYAYVQHPSYPTNWIVFCANTALFSRMDGLVGCWLPSAVVEWGRGLWAVVLVVFAGTAARGVWVRVKDEEAMLKGHFGEEWRIYNKRTARFVPFIF